jgi:DMSO/TMAO reductase YedYZ molybdopterin-dependent catalytic subunit
MTDRHPEIVRPEADLERELRKKSRRGFLLGGLAAVGAFGAYKTVRLARQDNEVPWPQRRVLDFNGKLWRSYLDDAHMMPTYSASEIGYLKPNGDHGLDEEPDDQGNPPEWDGFRLEGPDINPVTLQLSDVQALPRHEMITKFCCIEGWSVVQQWTGVRFSDFTKKFLPPGSTLTDYVYMATDGEDYFVGLDAKSAFHPQTLLAWEQNGKPLTYEHGAPLRLIIPVKYGIKNLKRIGLIRYTNQKPRDFWHEQGYDWFAGL